MHLKNLVCFSHLLHIFTSILTNLSIEANNVDPDQTAPIGAVWSGSTMFVQDAFFNIRADDKTDAIYCFWRFKGW